MGIGLPVNPPCLRQASLIEEGKVEILLYRREQRINDGLRSILRVQAQLIYWEVVL